MDALKEIQRSRTLVSLLRLGLHVSNFMNHGTGRVARAIQLKTISKFVNVRGTPQGALTENDKNSQVPPYACKTLMHFLAFVADDGGKVEKLGEGAAEAVSSDNSKKNEAKDEYGTTAKVFLKELSTLDAICSIDLAAVEIALKDLDKGLTLLRKELGLWQLSGVGDRRGDGVAGSTNDAHPGVAELKYFAHTFGEEVEKLKNVYEGGFTLGKRVMTVLGEASPVKQEGTDKAITVAEMSEFLKVILDVKRGFTSASKDNTNAQNTLRRNKQKAIAAEKAKEAAEAKKLMNAEKGDENETSRRENTHAGRKAPTRGHTAHGRARNNNTGAGRVRGSTSAQPLQRRNDRSNNSGGLLGALSRMRLDIAGANNGDSSSDEDWNSDED